MPTLVAILHCVVSRKSSTLCVYCVIAESRKKLFLFETFSAAPDKTFTAGVLDFLFLLSNSIVVLLETLT